MAFDKPDVVFSAAPIFHAYGLGNSLAFTLGHGGTVVLEPKRPITPLRVANILLQHKPSMFYGVPTGLNA